MKTLLEKLRREENGQGLVEYTLIVLLVVLVFWVGIRGTNIGGALTNGWNNIKNCVTTPTGTGNTC